MLITVLVIIALFAALSTTLLLRVQHRIHKSQQQIWNAQVDLAAAAVEELPVRPNELPLSGDSSLRISNDRVVLLNDSGRILAAAPLSAPATNNEP